MPSRADRLLDDLQDLTDASRRPSPPRRSSGPSLSFGLGIVAAIVIMAALGIRFVGSTPTGGQRPSPSVAAPNPTPTLPALRGSVPPIDTRAWTSLTLQRLEDGPSGNVGVVSWSGGYLAVGDPVSLTELPMWVSRDGQTWLRLKEQPLGIATGPTVARCGDLVLLAGTTRAGTMTLARSTDGITWTQGVLPEIGGSSIVTIIGGPVGALAILDGEPARVAFTTDGLTWQVAVLPGPSATTAIDAAPVGTGWAVVGRTSNTLSAQAGPLYAWWSADGSHWSQSTVPKRAEDFGSVTSGANGLVASAHDRYTPGLTTFWTSTDGHAWSPSAADPLGLITEGEGMGSANGMFVGDGTRILGVGSRTVQGPLEFWISSDAAHWTKLRIVGDSSVLTGKVPPFLMRDGILFVGPSGSWFAAAN